MFSKKPVAAARFDLDLNSCTPANSRPQSRTKSRGGKEKTLGELETLGARRAYASRYITAPARLNLTNALAAGQMRNPLDMVCQTQKKPKWNSGPDGEIFVQKVTECQVKRPASKRQDFSSTNPLRVDLPTYLNTPPVMEIGAHISEKKRIDLQRQIQDLELLSRACNRADKQREEGRALFSLGILEDNLGNSSRSLQHYTNFLKVCKGCGDMQGCALAFHCLGVCHQLLGTNPITKPAALRRALYFHSKHREHSDSGGKFIAHINMGLCYALLQEKESSTVNYQFALRHAIERNSIEEQSLALRNLGISSGMYDDDVSKQRTIVEKYMQLTNERQAAPLEKLGALASSVGDFHAGKEYFEEALQVAIKTKDTRTERMARVHLGITTAETLFEKHISSLLSKKNEFVAGEDFGIKIPSVKETIGSDTPSVKGTIRSDTKSVTEDMFYIME